MRNILMRMFGRPQGVLGRLGGIIMARMNADCGAWVVGLLEVGQNDSVLEVGFGPGVVIQRLSKLVTVGHVAGIDQSLEMVEQARARNATAIQSGRVDLRHGSVESLPFDDDSFDKVLAINAMQVWPDPVAGLREMRRVMKRGGRIALGFTPYSGQPNEGLPEKTHKRWLHERARSGDMQCGRPTAGGPDMRRRDFIVLLGGVASRVAARGARAAG